MKVWALALSSVGEESIARNSTGWEESKAGLRARAQYVRILEGFGHFVGKVCPDSGRQLLMRMFDLLEKLPVTTSACPSRLNTPFTSTQT